MVSPALRRALFLAPLVLGGPTPTSPSVETLSALSPRSTVSQASVAEGIDFSNWKLQLPIGEKRHPTTIEGDKLEDYSDPKKEYYYTDDDGTTVMKVPGSPESTGCVTTEHSKHCRTELRESSPPSWDPNAKTNRLSASLTVTKAGGTICIGQIHIDDKISTKPVAELYYSSQGEITMGVERTRKGGDQVTESVGHVALNTKFSYEIAYENNELSVALNGEQKKVFETYELDAPKSYFKAGNYNQGSGETEVHFYGIKVEH